MDYAEKAYAAGQFKQSTAYPGDMTSNAYQEGSNGLLRLAEQISENALRINQIAASLQQVSMGIHGPRPEPVTGERAGNSPPQSDSLVSRVQSMTSAVDHLQRVYESLVR